MWLSWSSRHITAHFMAIPDSAARLGFLGPRVGHTVFPSELPFSEDWIYTRSANRDMQPARHHINQYLSHWMTQPVAYRCHSPFAFFVTDSGPSSAPPATNPWQLNGTNHNPPASWRCALPPSTWLVWSFWSKKKLRNHLVLGCNIKEPFNSHSGWLLAKLRSETATVTKLKVGPHSLLRAAQPKGALWQTTGRLGRWAKKKKRSAKFFDHVVDPQKYDQQKKLAEVQKPNDAVSYCLGSNISLTLRTSTEFVNLGMARMEHSKTFWDSNDWYNTNSLVAQPAKDEFEFRKSSHDKWRCQNLDSQLILNPDV